MQYIYINSGGMVFPCDLYELKLTFKYNKTLIGRGTIIEKWPDHSHGPEFNFEKDKGVIVLDLLSKEPTTPMTKEELDVILDD